MLSFSNTVLKPNDRHEGFYVDDIILSKVMIKLTDKPNIII